jgi:hypothetical protein
LWSVEHGVGNFRQTASVRLLPVRLLPDRLASLLVGVGHIPVFAMVSSEGFPRLGRSCGTFPSFWLEPYDVRVGVGNGALAIPPVGSEYPEPLADMRSTGVVCSQHAPPRIVPAFGQTSEYSAKVPVRKETWNVLQECESRSYVANDSDRLWPHVSFIVGGPSLPGDRKRLTGKPACNHVNTMSKSSRVERSDVIPNWEQAKHAVALSP